MTTDSKQSDDSTDFNYSTYRGPTRNARNDLHPDTLALVNWLADEGAKRVDATAGNHNDMVHAWMDTGVHTVDTPGDTELYAATPSRAYDGVRYSFEVHTQD